MAVTCDDPADPNHAILADNLVRLKKARDARGRALEVIELPQPREARHLDGERLALSYVNYYIANGGIVMPSFDDANDDKARDIVAVAFTGRRVVQVPALRSEEQTSELQSTMRLSSAVFCLHTNN